MDPNCKRTENLSGDSLSGDNYDRTRKRMRTNNKKIKYTGRKTDLPKARQHCPNDAIEDAAAVVTVSLSDCDSDRQSDKNDIGIENSRHSCDLQTSSSPLKVIELFNIEKSNSNVSATSFYSTCYSQTKLDPKVDCQSMENVKSNSPLSTAINSQLVLCSKLKIVNSSTQN